MSAFVKYVLKLRKQFFKVLVYEKLEDIIVSIKQVLVKEKSVIVC